MSDSLGGSILPLLTDRVRFGPHSLSVSPICLGTVGTPEVVLAAFDAGINFFFLSADMHWPYYEALRRGLAMLLKRSPGARDQIVVAGTAYVTQPEFCEAPFEEVLMACPGLERLDVLSMGGSYWPDFLARLPIYQRHLRTGFCGARAISSSFHDRTVAAKAIEYSLVDLAFARYNPAHVGARADLFPSVRSPHRTPLFTFKSTYSFLTGDWWQRLGMPEDGWKPQVTDYYRFAAGCPEIDGLLVSLHTPQQVGDLAEALAKGPLSADQQRIMELAASRAQAWSQS